MCICVGHVYVYVPSTRAHYTVLYAAEDPLPRMLPRMLPRCRRSSWRVFMEGLQLGSNEIKINEIKINEIKINEIKMEQTPR